MEEREPRSHALASPTCLLAPSHAQIRGGEGVVDRVLECPKARLLFGRTNGGPLLRLYCSVTDFRPWSTVNFVPSPFRPR